MIRIKLTFFFSGEMMFHYVTFHIAIVELRLEEIRCETFINILLEVQKERYRSVKMDFALIFSYLSINHYIL